MVWFTYIVIGLFAGLIARAVVPGKQPMGLFATTVLGIAGSLLGGILGSLFSPGGPKFQVGGSGLIMSVVGAIVVLLAVGWYNARKRISA